MLKALLQGKWMGHPLHPVLLTIPFGLWPMALVFDLLSLGGLAPDVMARAAYWSVLIGLIGAVLAVPAGIADWLDIKPERPAWKIGLYHMIINGIAFILWLIDLWLRAGPGSRVTGSIAILSVIATVVVFAGGYFGGNMVYAHGTAVARFSKNKWRGIAEAGGAHVAPQKGA